MASAFRVGSDVQTLERLQFSVGQSTPLQLNEWSFSQLCRLSGVSKDTVNRLKPDTASRVFAETMPRTGNKPFQLFTEGEMLRSIHGASYTRVYDADLWRCFANSRSTFSLLKRA